MRISAAIIAIAIATPTFAAERTSGWWIGFYQDNFSRRVYPVAMIRDQSKSYAPGGLSISCKDGSLSFWPTFPSDYFATDKTRSVEFRAGDYAATLEATIQDTGAIGKQYVLEGDGARKLFEKSLDASEISFRFNEKTVTVSTVGLPQAMTYMKAECAGN
jgi:hypothetical protein